MEQANMISKMIREIKEVVPCDTNEYGDNYSYVGITLTCNNGGVWISGVGDPWFAHKENTTTFNTLVKQLHQLVFGAK